MSRRHEAHKRKLPHTKKLTRTTTRDARQLHPNTPHHKRTPAAISRHRCAISSIRSALAPAAHPGVYTPPHPNKLPAPPPFASMYRYHHATVLLFCWHAYSARIGTGLWYAAMNYSVHGIMYAYFGMTQVCNRTTGGGAGGGACRRGSEWAGQAKNRRAHRPCGRSDPRHRLAAPPLPSRPALPHPARATQPQPTPSPPLPAATPCLQLSAHQFRRPGMALRISPRSSRC